MTDTQEPKPEVKPTDEKPQKKGGLTYHAFPREWSAQQMADYINNLGKPKQVEKKSYSPSSV